MKLADSALSAPLEEQLEFFGRVGQGFERAAHNCDELVERFYNIGGFRVRLECAGRALAEGLTAAFAHLRIAPTDEVDLSVGLWDSVSTGVPLASPPWGADDYLQRCGVRGYTDGRVCASYEVVNEILSVVDTKTNRGYFRIRDAAQLPLYQCGSPLLLLLHQWLAVQGVDLVHGGAVGTPQGGVMLAGRGGSGKSTATLSCLDSPLLYAADDYGVVRGGEKPYFYSLYSSGKVNLPDADKHSILARARPAGILDTQKALFFLHEYYSDRLSTGFPLRAIVVPRVSGERATRIRPISGARALLALAPSTIFQLPGAENQKFARLSQLTKTLPAYAMDSGTDWRDIPRALHDLVTMLNALNDAIN